MTNNEIIFDAGSGISEEEQREILAAINGIAEKNRQSLASGADNSGGKKKLTRRFKAKKSGGLFPVLVNIIAIAVLAGGAFALYTFQEKNDAQVREGAKVYNIAEREIINAIRTETSSRLEAKENEIVLIISKLEGVDAELQNLYANRQELSTEQQDTESRLLAMQEEYRTGLELLQDERSRILDESRVREAALQTQLENRDQELALVSEQSAAAIDQARSEMEKLSREQSQTASIEAQMAAFFSNLNTMIAGNRLDEAAGIIASMRSFLDTPAFQGFRFMQARKELYNQSINAFETMIAETRRNQAALATGIMPAEDSALTALQEQKVLLEQAIAEKDKAIEAQEKTMEESENELTRRVTDLERSASQKDSRITILERNYDTLERTSTQKDTRIRSLETDLARQTESARTSQQRANNLQTENTNLTQTVRQQDTSLTAIQDILRGKNIDDMSLNEIRASVVQIQSALGSTE